MENDVVYVIHEQDYDLFWINAVITKDKLEDYAEKFYKEKLKDYQDPNKVKSIKRLDKENNILWEVEFTDEYLLKVYDGYLNSNSYKHTLDELKGNRKHLTYFGFDFTILKINEYNG